MLQNTQEPSLARGERRAAGAAPSPRSGVSCVLLCLYGNPPNGHTSPCQISSLNGEQILLRSGEEQGLWVPLQHHPRAGCLGRQRAPWGSSVRGFMAPCTPHCLGSCSDLCWSLKVVSSSFGGKKPFSLCGYTEKSTGRVNPG